MAAQLRIKLHFVLWGAACMLWAQPEHLAFAVLEAEDVESVLQFLGALVPPTWTYKVRPVWNLPSQLRLIRQVQLAPTMLTGDELTQPRTPSTTEVGEPGDSGLPEPEVSDAGPPEDTSGSIKPSSEDPAESDDGFKTQPPVSVSFPPGDTGDGENVAERAPVADVADTGDPAGHRTWPQTDSDAGAPSTITRLLEELETPVETPEHAAPDPANQGSASSQPPSTDQATHIEQFVPPPPPRVRAWLVATSGPSRGSSFELPREGATVGRLPENTIYIPDERLSREHARIDFQDGKFVLTDLGSRNGTAVNGALISTPQPLNNGDTIELGSNTLVVNIETQP